MSQTNYYLKRFFGGMKKGNRKMLQDIASKDWPTIARQTLDTRATPDRDPEAEGVMVLMCDDVLREIAARQVNPAQIAKEVLNDPAIR